MKNKYANLKVEIPKEKINKGSEDVPKSKVGRPKGSKSSYTKTKEKRKVGRPRNTEKTTKTEVKASTLYNKERKRVIQEDLKRAVNKSIATYRERTGSKKGLPKYIGSEYIDTLSIYSKASSINKKGIRIRKQTIDNWGSMTTQNILYKGEEGLKLRTEALQKSSPDVQKVNFIKSYCQALRNISASENVINKVKEKLNSLSASQISFFYENGDIPEINFMYGEEYDVEELLNKLEALSKAEIPENNKAYKRLYKQAEYMYKVKETETLLGRGEIGTRAAKNRFNKLEEMYKDFI